MPGVVRYLRGITFVLVAIGCLIQPAGPGHLDALAMGDRAATASAVIAVAPSAAAPGATLHISGYGLDPGTRYNIFIGSALGQATTDHEGMLQATVTLPSLPPGQREIGVAPLDGQYVSTRLTILAAPVLRLSTMSGAPGTVVNATVENLVPGSLRIDYAGVPLLGPLPVPTSSWRGSFVVPNDRPRPLGTATPVTAVNLVSGNVVGVAAAVNFLAQPAPAPQRPVLRNMQVPVAPLHVGEPITISGQLAIDPSEQLSDYRILALWKTADAPPIPLAQRQLALQPDGSFTLSVAAPSLLNGDALPATTSGTVGLVAISTNTNAYHEAHVAIAPATSEVHPQIRVLRQGDRSVIIGAKITRTLLATQQIILTGNTIMPANGVFESYGDLSWLVLGPGDVLAHISALSHQCEIQAENPLQAIYADPHEKVVLPQSFELPAQGIPLISPVGLPDTQRASTAAAPVTAEVYHVTVDATKQGYGNVTPQGILAPYQADLLVVPSQNLAFEIITAEGEVTAKPVPYPLTLVLPKLPGSYLSATVLDLRSNGPAVGQGYLHSLAGLALPADTLLSTAPLTVELVVERASDVAVATPTFRWDGAPVAFTAAETMFNPPSEQDPCLKPGGIPEPPRRGTIYRVTIPSAHMLAPGRHTLVYQFSNNLGQPGQISFDARADVPGWIGDPSYARRWVRWAPSKVQLIAERDGQQADWLSTSAAETPRTGPIRNTAYAGCIRVWQTLSPSGPTFAGVSGSAGGEALSGSANTTFGSESCGSPPAAAPRQAPPPRPLFESKDIPVVPRVTFAQTQQDFGVPFVITVGFGSSMWFDAHVTRAGALTFDANGNPADTIITVTPTGAIGGEVHFDAKLLGGLLARAEARLSADLSLSMPIEFRNGAADQLTGNFRYHAYLTLSFGALCDPTGIIGGCVKEVSRSYDIIGPNCKGHCTRVVGEELRAATSAAAPPDTEPAIATDALGNTLAVWRAGADRLAYSRYENGIWSAPATIPTGLGPFSPTIAFSGPNRAVAVWVESSLSAAQAQAGTMETAIRSQHLAYAVWDGSAWSPAQPLTTPDLGEGRVVLAGCRQGLPACPAGGEVTAVWERNVAANFGLRQIRLFYAIYRNGAWGAIRPVDAAAATLAPTDTQPSVAYQQGAPLVAWVRDADHDLATLDDRRIAMLQLGADRLIEQPAGLPGRVAEVSLAVAPDGAPRLAFTAIEPGAALLDTRHALYTGSAASGAAGSPWSVQPQLSKGRPVYAEQPVLTLAAGGSGTITFRGMGFGADSRGASRRYPDDPIGMISHTGELSQLETDFTSAARDPRYLTRDGAVNWQPAAVYDALTESTIALAVAATTSSEAPQLQAAPTTAQSRASALAAGAPLIFASVPRQPDFAVTGVTLSTAFPQPGQPLSVAVELHNDGIAWSGRGQALDLVATWDGGPGVGTEAGRAQLASLGAGQMVSLTLRLEPPPTLDRPHTLSVTVNPRQTIAEPSALDNQQRVVAGGIPAPAQIEAGGVAGTARVLLRWKAVDDPRVVGYRIYRVALDGTPTPVGSSFGAAFVDRNVALDQRYRYTVTSYTQDGIESAQSQPALITTGRIQVFLPLIRQ